MAAALSKVSKVGVLLRLIWAIDCKFSDWMESAKLCASILHLPLTLFNSGLSRGE